MPDTIAEIGERALVERIRLRAGLPPPWLHIGIGDDAAVFQPDRGTLQVITSDGLVEDVHFETAWTSPGAIGYKAVAINLSDLAAMGAEPRGLLLSLSLPSTYAAADFDALVDGAIAAASDARAHLVGGNLARSRGPVVVDVTAFGSVRPRRVLTRAGGRPGDEIYVTGTLGAAAAGLMAFRRHLADRAALSPEVADCVDRYERPRARVRCGMVVGRSRSAHAAIDLSDGIAAAARQLAEASGTGVVIDGGRVPVHPGAVTWANGLGADPVRIAISGGEDYELLFAVPARRRRAFEHAIAQCRGLAVTSVGHLTKDAGAWLDLNGTREPLGSGFQHF